MTFSWCVLIIQYTSLDIFTNVEIYLFPWSVISSITKIAIVPRCVFTVWMAFAILGVSLSNPPLIKGNLDWRSQYNKTIFFVSPERNLKGTGVQSGRKGEFDSVEDLFFSSFYIFYSSFFHLFLCSSVGSPPKKKKSKHHAKAVWYKQMYLPLVKT